jgi:hypothetical protein
MVLGWCKSKAIGVIFEEYRTGTRWSAPPMLAILLPGALLRQTSREDETMIRRMVLPGVAALVLTAAGAASAAGSIQQTRHVGAYGITLMVEGPVTTHMMGSGSGAETMAGGKNPTCVFKGSLGPSGGKTCNHHIEVHITRNGKVDINASVSITLTNTRTHAVSKVPIMAMFGKDVRDYHFGNNVYVPAGTYMVSVKADTARARFTVKL